MINRWQGNSGRVQRLPEPEDRRKRPGQGPDGGMPKREARPEAAPSKPVSAPCPSRGQGGKSGGLLSGLEGLTRLLPGKMEALETEDIILLLILYLMYRENGDRELLMIMGAMFLL